MEVAEGFVVISQEEYEGLQEQVRALREKLSLLKKTSANSSKPPSSDIVKQKPKNKKGKKGKIGGQPGHAKHKRKLFTSNEVDKIQEYHLSICPDCNHILDIDTEKEPRIVQQVEIIDVPLIIEEHRSSPYWCSNCQKHHYCGFPDAVVKAGLFKAKITALVH